MGASAHAHAQGLGGQGQGTHLAGFGAGGPGEYGYADGQRVGFVYRRFSSIKTEYDIFPGLL